MGRRRERESAPHSLHRLPLTPKRGMASRASARSSKRVLAPPDGDAAVTLPPTRRARRGASSQPSASDSQLPESPPASSLDLSCPVDEACSAAAVCSDVVDVAIRPSLEVAAPAVPLAPLSPAAALNLQESDAGAVSPVHTVPVGMGVELPSAPLEGNEGSSLPAGVHEPSVGQPPHQPLPPVLPASAPTVVASVADAASAAAMPGSVPRNPRRKKQPSERLQRVHGNLDRYPNEPRPSAAVPEYFADERIRAFQLRPEWFAGKSCLDVGCNAGYIAIACAVLLNVKRIEGVDIDAALVDKARRLVISRTEAPEATPPTASTPPPLSPSEMSEVFSRFPWNVTFRREDMCPLPASAGPLDKLQVITRPSETYDVVICLKVTMFVHLNHGDEGLKALFKRLYSLVRPAGKLIIEFQPFRKYKAQRKVSEACRAHYRNIKLLPDCFEKYLLNAVGFRRVTRLDPAGLSLKRPLFAFTR